MRIQPQNIEAEESVLGACMVFREAVPAALSTIAAADFFDPKHALIFTAISELSNQGRGVDMVSVVSHLGAKVGLAGGAAYISELTDGALGHSLVKQHCRIIKDRAKARKAIVLAGKIAEACYRGDDMRGVLDDFSTGFLKLAGKDRGRPETLAEIMPRVMEQVEEIAFNGRSFGIPTGFIDLDRRLSGMARGDLIVIAARPSMGKTVLGVDIALNVAEAGGRVLVVSLEMSKDQIAMRMLSNRSSIDGYSIKAGNLNDYSWPKVKQARATLDRFDLTIIDDSALSITEIRGMAKSQHMQKPLDLVVVDYMQLSTAQAQSREREISEISSGMKAMAKDLNIPVIALSQLNRSLESRDDKRPRLSDLRESGSIEQDADVVIFIYRDEVYRKELDNPNRGIAEIITAKFRNGQTGIDKLLFQGEFSRFQNYTTEI